MNSLKLDVSSYEPVQVIVMLLEEILSWTHAGSHRLESGLAADLLCGVTSGVGSTLGLLHCQDRKQQPERRVLGEQGSVYGVSGHVIVINGRATEKQVSCLDSVNKKWTA